MGEFPNRFSDDPEQGARSFRIYHYGAAAGVSGFLLLLICGFFGYAIFAFSQIGDPFGGLVLGLLVGAIIGAIVDRKLTRQAKQRDEQNAASLREMRRNEKAQQLLAAKASGAFDQFENKEGQSE